MSEFTLHCFLESGNAYKAALMLALCDADWEARRVAFFVGETRSPEFRARNVMGEVSGIRRLGAVSLDLAYIAAGRMDGFWERGLSPRQAPRRWAPD